MPVQLASFLIPRNSAKWFLLEDVYFKGGYRALPTVADRDAIHSSCLKVGMLVRTNDTGQTWRYAGSVEGWVLQPLGAGAVTAVHEQTEPAESWVFNHGKNSRFFTYAAFDASGRIMVPDDVKIINVNTVELTWIVPVSGHVTLTFA